ncbi:MAG: flagellar biosynthetic protein FliR [Nocardioidaceae bacterium]
MVVTLSGAPLVAYLMASLRIASWLVLVPPYSSKAVPSTVKALLAFALALAIAPSLRGTVPPTDTVGLVETAVQEVLVGAVMGFVTYLVLAAVQAAGDLIDVFGGFSLAAAFDPLNQNMNSVNGKLFGLLATMLLFASNAHLLILGGLLRSFDAVPVGAGWQVGSVADVMTRAFGLFFASAVQIALPLIAVLFLADLGLALLTKVAPSLNAMGIMFPAKIALTLTVVGLSFAVLPDALSRLTDMLSSALGALQ